MIEVRIPKEIREYKEKLFFGLNLRQSICTALALAICIPLYIFGKRFINAEVLSWLIIIIAIPLILIGFFNFNQMTFEKFILAWIKMQIHPQKRKFKNEDRVYTSIRNEIIKEDIQSQRNVLKGIELELDKKKNSHK